MALLSIEEASQALRKYGEHPKDTASATVAMNATLLNAAVQLETTDRTVAASNALTESIDGFTEASDRGTAELANY
jgi:hypothetical protein